MSVTINKKVVETVESVTLKLTPKQASVLMYILGSAIGGDVIREAVAPIDGGLCRIWRSLDNNSFALPKVDLKKREGFGCMAIDFK